MNILYSEEGIIKKELKELFSEAGVLALSKEGINADNAEISISFVSGEEIRELNRNYRGIDKETDVLSFPLMENKWDCIKASEASDETSFMLGDVVICLEKAYDQAAEYGHSETREIVYLFVHSLLHLIGYDHMCDEDKREMREREENIMTELKIGRDV